MAIFSRSRQDDEDSNPNSYSAVPYNKPRGLTAAATRIDLSSKKEVDAIDKRRTADKWQSEAWDYYDIIGELKQSANMVANEVSRINIYAGYISDSSQIPSRIQVIDTIDEEYRQKAQDAMYLLETGPGGCSGLLRAMALNFFVVGECYLVREPARTFYNEPEKYTIRSVDELVTISTRAKGRSATGSNAPQLGIKPRRDSKTTDYIKLPQNGYVARLWRPHPRYQDEADSSVRGVLDLCDEVMLHSRSAAALVKSRLNGGILYIPDGLSGMAEASPPMAAPNDDGSPVVDTYDEASDNIEEELIDAMVTPISDPGSASSVVPLIIRGPEDLGNKIVHIKLDRPFDPALTERGKDALERLLDGLDLPKEIVSGMGGLKGAAAKILEDALYSQHLEPLILLICDTLTDAFLRPALRALGFPEDLVQRTVIWFDPSAITSKPSKAESSIQLYDKNIIGADAVRRAHGFAASDAPTQLEIAQKLAVAKGLLSQPLSEKLISTLVPDLMADLRKEQMQQSDPNSAKALNQALSDGPAPATDANAGDDKTPDKGDGDDKIDTSSTQPPPSLLEP
jgi:hypothetical protein